MSRAAVNLKLVSAPPPVRTCDFCGGKLTPIELWHDCPELSLARGLYGLRLDFRNSLRGKRHA